MMKNNPESREEQETAHLSDNLVGKALEAKMEETVFRRKSLKRQIIVTVFLMAVILLLFRVIFGLAKVEGSSMYPEYHDGDIVVYLRLTDSPERNDVVLVKMNDGRILIKRVIGLPGEEVYIDGRTGSVFIDGMELQEDYSATDPGEVLRYPLTLEEDEYFLLGDNRDNSMDSRSYGPVTADQIRGKVLMTFRID